MDIDLEISNKGQTCIVDHNNNQYINQDPVRLCVCPSRMWRHFRNVYSGNEATTYTVTRTLGTSLLTVGTADIGQL